MPEPSICVHNALVCSMNSDSLFWITVITASAAIPSNCTSTHATQQSSHTWSMTNTQHFTENCYGKKMFLKHFLRNIVFHQIWSIFFKGRIMLNLYILPDTWLSHWEAPLHLNLVLSNIGSVMQIKSRDIPNNYGNSFKISTDQSFNLKSMFKMSRSWNIIKIWEEHWF